MNKRKLILYFAISLTGLMAGYGLSQNRPHRLLAEPETKKTVLSAQPQESRPPAVVAHSGDCLEKEVKKTAEQYGFQDLNQENWDAFITEVKKQHLRAFEKKTGINYFQVITLTGDITKADRFFSMTAADINQPDATGMTPLAHAARNGDVEAVKALHRYGADLTRPVVYIPKYQQKPLFQEHFRYPPETPLKMAVLQNDPVNTPEIIRYLLENGATFSNGNNYLFSALSNPDIMEEFLREILDHTDFNKSILPYTLKDKTNAVGKIFQYDQTGSAIGYLYEKGLSPQTHEDSYSPVLSHAILNKANTVQDIEKLIEEGFDVNRTGRHYKTGSPVGISSPLCYAIRRKDLEIAALLLENGATVTTYAMESADNLKGGEKSAFLNLLKKYEGDSY